MDVLVGSTSAATASCLFLNQNGVVGGGGKSGIGACGGGGGGGGPQKARSEQAESFSSSSSSSIGAPDDSDEENASKQGSGDVTDSEEVQSKFNGRRGGLTSLGSMGSLEDSLPIKRGLSNYFSGKSKSFASLSDVVTTATTVKEVEKRENPFNKRRRVLIASKWSRKSSSSFYNHPNPKSMPLLASLNEDEEEQEPEETQEDPSSGQSSSDEKEPHMVRTPKLLDRGLKSFKSRSCYCLSDLQEHEQ
ncbi:protein OXIDATIVE STRESS 3 LIKE 4-like [Rosa rugosa]|uniref:protein OXIDATIVE STRESS 3 LIKE 4-like n=1 Tax=Rosa rugosa TaxID=74645 RepID=UPI002B411C9E|nr:protein OXIDATIVE STRESS 3 LIKE 4-like [Rosa rugosa]